MYEQRNFYACLFSCTACLCSLLFGIYIGGKLKICDQQFQLENIHSTELEDEIENQNNILSTSASDSVYSLAAQKFACNPGIAYDELTRLHKKAYDLQASKSKQSNRDRTATIVRKAGQAVAAESSFRNCVAAMMPELLELWKKNLKDDKISYTAWGEHREKGIDGITQEVLEEAAEALDTESQ